VRPSTLDPLARLERDHPEWAPWLAPLAQARHEAGRPEWESYLPPPPPAADEVAPLLSGLVLGLDRRFATIWLDELAHTAAAAGSEGAASLQDRAGDLDGLAVLEAALNLDRGRLAALAADVGAPAAAVEALAGLAAWPLMQACGRLWASRVPSSWRCGYCPICGAWPTLAETRGVERQRRFRCARCGGDWHADWLACPYCGTTDHARLGSLVSEATAERRRVDVCRGCGHYLKALTTLQGTPGADVAVDDLASVDLDVIALQHAFTRPEGPGFPLGLRLVDAPRPGRRRFAWRS
jgi:FdhE protein